MIHYLHVDMLERETNDKIVKHEAVAGLMRAAILIDHQKFTFNVGTSNAGHT